MMNLRSVLIEAAVVLVLAAASVAIGFSCTVPP